MYATSGERYDPKTSALVERGQALGDRDLTDARLGRQKLRAELVALMDANAIDAWLAPSALGAAPAGLESTGDAAMNLPWTHSGLPAVSLPSGMNDAGLPFGLQVIGRWQADEQLLAWAEQVEPQLEIGVSVVVESDEHRTLERT